MDLDQLGSQKHLTIFPDFQKMCKMRMSTGCGKIMFTLQLAELYTSKQNSLRIREPLYHVPLFHEFPTGIKKVLNLTMSHKATL